MDAEARQCGEPFPLLQLPSITPTGCRPPRWQLAEHQDRRAIYNGRSVLAEAVSRFRGLGVADSCIIGRIPVLQLQKQGDLMPTTASPWERAFGQRDLHDTQYGFAVGIYSKILLSEVLTLQTVRGGRP